MPTSIVHTAVIGAGPAGLTAAYDLSRHGHSVLVLEADPAHVGGIARTVDHRGFKIDIGGHRFFSKSKEVEDLWTEFLGDDLIVRPRASRIFYRGRFFSYPLKASDAFLGLGAFESLRCFGSYLRAKFDRRASVSFEDWAVRQFGRRLYEIFFKSYTEKVWGMKCTELSADWAAQRIQKLSLGRAILDAVLPRGRPEKSLLKSFRYPRFGPGMLWSAAARKVQGFGGEVVMGARLTAASYANGVWDLTVRVGEVDRLVRAEHLISSAPMTEMYRMLVGEPRDSGLRYRHMILVSLMLRDRLALTDNWIYLQDPDLRASRIQNTKAWSESMVPDSSRCCYGLEYFCGEDDELWSMTDDELIALAKREIALVGLAGEDEILDAVVVRQPRAYPVYDPGYAARVADIRDRLAREFPTLHLVGRNGMHRYNNQDHSMLTALYTARNIRLGERRFDPWAVNIDDDYHEA